MRTSLVVMGPAAANGSVACDDADGHSCDAVAIGAYPDSLTAAICADSADHDGIGRGCSLLNWMV